MEEMQTTLENKTKVVANSPRNVVKRKNIVEEVGASSSRMEREQKSIDVKAHKMMKGRVEPFAMPI